MEKEFIPYKESLELRDLRFDEPCFGAYGAWGFMSSNDVNSLSDEVTQEDLNNESYTEEDGVCLAPTYSQAFRFFRKKYGLNGISPSRIYKTDFYQSRIIDWNTWNEIDVIQCSSYEEAELACLKKLIEIVKQQNQP
jgi:hypothetical protein